MFLKNIGICIHIHAVSILLLYRIYALSMLHLRYIYALVLYLSFTDFGDTSYYKTKNGYFSRKKGGFSSERVKNDPVYELTRKNGKEFGRASMAGKLLRTAFRGSIVRCPDIGMASRLTKAMLTVVMSDMVNLRGARTVICGDVRKLEGFEFNKHGLLSKIFHVDYVATID
jgi:hypothetical protein